MRPVRKTHHRREVRLYGGSREFFARLNHLLRIATSKPDAEMLPDIICRWCSLPHRATHIPTRGFCAICQRQTIIDQRVRPGILPTLWIFGRMAPLGRAE